MAMKPAAKTPQDIPGSPIAEPRIAEVAIAKRAWESRPAISHQPQEFKNYSVKTKEKQDYGEH